MKIKALPKLLFVFFLSSLFGCDNEDDPQEPQLPEVVTVSDETEAAVTYTSVEINGSIKETDEITAYGVAWGTEPNPTLEDNVAFPESGAAATSSSNRYSTKQAEDSFVVRITDLDLGETYYFRTFATNDAGTAYGDEISLETPGLAESTWKITFHHEEDVSWMAHLSFYEDGTAFYTEPDAPGVYDSWGVWHLEGNFLTYDMLPDDDRDDYILTGDIIENEVSGTYTWGDSNRPWSGFVISTEED
ncbi:hypothetical protein [Salinimicrobium oceani]|uniref:Fibronectin type-III domain-containing protein n=1 Tax=Salinimicrobium oceani TaxID=2722702 RepID=A0ABX1CWE4_9FLAO|nr:hypothetical protein [Salinimicrobium oceani]NJW52611.1 hypothetical protein [Salinimicrobium oceani]